MLRNNLEYPKDADFQKTYGPRGIIHSFAGGKIRDLGPLTKMHTADCYSIPDMHWFFGAFADNYSALVE
jgi:hypothetical protein